MSKMNFIDDINKIAGELLRDLDVESDLKSKDNLVEFLRYHILWIPKIPREVHISKQLNESQKFKQYEKAIAFIKEKIEKGEDIMPFASARKKPSKKGENPYNDDLLNDWGIYHLHLGTEYSKSGKIKRSEDLLFCIINLKSVYFIDIQGHRDNWANKELLEIVYDNWSELLEPYELDMIPDYNYTSEEIRDFRKIGSNMCVTLKNDKTFMIGNFAVDGTSMQVVYRVKAIEKELKRLENKFKTDKEIVEKLGNYSTIKLTGCGLSALGFTFMSFSVDNGKIIYITPSVNGIHISIK